MVKIMGNGFIERYIKRYENQKITIEYLLMFLVSALISHIIFKTFRNEKVNLAHIIFLLVCMFISLSSFLTLWLTYGKGVHTNYILCFGLFSITILSLFHTYFFFCTKYNNGSFSDISTAYWIMTRLTEAVITILSTTRIAWIIPNKRISTFTALVLSLVSPVLILVLHGINTFHLLPEVLRIIQTIVEYIIIIMFIISLLVIKFKFTNIQKTLYLYIYLAVLLVIPAEIFLTFIKDTNSYYNILGHTLKTFCYFCLFRGIFVKVVYFPFQCLKKAIVKLNDSKNDLTDILNGLPLGIIAYGKDLRVSFINNKTCELFQCSLTDMLGKTAAEIGETFAADKTSLVYELDKNPKKQLSIVKEYKTLTGEDISLNSNMFKYKNGIFVSISDTQKDQELDNLKIQTSIILNSVSNLIIITDTHYKIINCNKALVDCIEMKSSHIIGMNIINLVKTLGFTTNGISIDNPEELLKTDHTTEVSFKTPKGNRRHIIFHCNEILSTKNKVIGFILVLTDITAIKSEQEKIKQQEKLAIIGQMGAGIVHETKNHLASIKGYCQLLSLSIKEPGLKKYINRIESISSDLNKVIVDFLSLAKPTDTIMDVISINEIIRSMRYMLESPSFMKGVKIIFDLEDFDKDIKADESQIKQVILNITKNAIEAMSDTKDATLNISTRLCPSGNEVSLSISDNGKGISPENLKKLGTPFYTTKDNGTGLGLNISYNIMKEHQGYIEVHSTEGKGTEFILFFPCVDDTKEKCSEFRDCI
jgi:PAS domain S-box-containing protein